MFAITNRKLIKMTRRLAASSLLIIVVFICFASKGGGEKKKNTFKADFTPIRSLNTFTLKSTPVYSGSYSFIHDRENDRLTVNTSLTYQRGNTVFIFPYKYRVNINPSISTAQKTNLQFLGVKIKIPK